MKQRKVLVEYIPSGEIYDAEIVEIVGSELKDTFFLVPEFNVIVNDNQIYWKIVIV